MVALTGYGAPRDRQQTVEAGFDHHLVKPASIDALRTPLRPPSDASASSSEPDAGAE
jgi:CheY-like chemotaxis protein